MEKQETALAEGDIFDNVLLETYKEIGISRPRVRPINFFDKDIRVEFPRDLRENNPLKTRFRASVKVCQKHYQKGKLEGQPKGQPYLRADNSTIEKVDSFTPKDQERRQ